MNIAKYVGGPVDANCYIITFNTKAIIIDPCVKLDIIKKALGIYKLDFIIVTHGHYDHVCNLKEVVDYYKVNVYLAKNAISKLEDPFKNCSALLGMLESIKCDNDVYHIVNDYEKVEVDGDIITFIHTPGHTDCSICIRIGEALFTGDTLFKGGIGRCDLYSGNLAKMQISLANLKKYFEKTDVDLVIYPGHEEASTSKEELVNNPYL